METSMLGAFLLLSLTLYGTPGPATLSLAASGAAFGLRRSIPYVLGILVGLAINLLLVACGLGALLAAHPGARTAFQVGSFVFLLYLAWKLARSAPAHREGAKRRFTLLEGVILNVANPKAYVAALAVLTPFLTRGEPERPVPVAWMLTLLAAVLAIAAVVDLLWVVAGGVLGRIFSSPRKSRILHATLAVLLVAGAVVALLAA